jgi:hypothetical protein
LAVRLLLTLTGEVEHKRTVKIEKDLHQDIATIRLIGEFRSEHLGELTEQVEHNGVQIILDLKETTLVDVYVVRFLSACIAKGMKIVHCPRYIKMWLVREIDS